MAKSKQKQDLSPSLTKLISYNNVDVSFELKGKQKLRAWVEKCVSHERKKLAEISFNFCSDKHLLSINKKYLNHNYFTDIITFDFCDNSEISGDIYISVERVKENAKDNQVLFHVELARVIIHGVLHLCGYKDKTAKDLKTMRNKEDYYLSLLR